MPYQTIRPYPSQYVIDWAMRDGTVVTIRPIRPDDEPLLIKFHEELSDRSVMFRYFHAIKLSARTDHERLKNICHVDYDKDLAFVAQSTLTPGDARLIMGIGRLSKSAGGKEAEFAIVISDRWQGRGLSTEILKHPLYVATQENIERLFMTIMTQNLEMQHLAERLGFKLARSMTESEVHATFDLSGAS